MKCLLFVFFSSSYIQNPLLKEDTSYFYTSLFLVYAIQYNLCCNKKILYKSCSLTTWNGLKLLTLILMGKFFQIWNKSLFEQPSQTDYVR